MRKLLLLTLVVVFYQCQNAPQKSSEDNQRPAEQKEFVQNEENVKMIFYNVPSPVEMVSLIEDAGAKYNKDLLNSYKNVDNYITTEDLALNLGVYGADLSYNRIFDQMQESIQYLAAIRKIADELKIPQEEGSFAVNKFEENLENKDSLLQIISETYANADMYLKESNRETTAALIILGGWIEALYIATNLVDEKNPDTGIMERIAEQKYAIQHINQMIETHMENSVMIEKLYPALKKMEESFNKIDIAYEKGDVITDRDSKSTKIGGTTAIHVDYTTILEIKKIITEIRFEVIGKSQ